MFRSDVGVLCQWDPGDQLHLQPSPGPPPRQQEGPGPPQRGKEECREVCRARQILSLKDVDVGLTTLVYHPPSISLFLGQGKIDKSLCRCPVDMILMWTGFIYLYWKVYTSEGLSLASRLGVLFSEISVAESASDLDTVLNPVIVGVWRRKKEAFHEEQKVRGKCFPVLTGSKIL